MHATLSCNANPWLYMFEVVPRGSLMRYFSSVNMQIWIAIPQITEIWTMSCFGNTKLLQMENRIHHSYEWKWNILLYWKHSGQLKSMSWGWKFEIPGENICPNFNTVHCPPSMHCVLSTTNFLRLLRWMHQICILIIVRQCKAIWWDYFKHINSEAC